MMIAKLLLLLILSSLAACGSAPSKRPQESPAPPAPQARPSAAEKISADSWKYKIIELAKEEWIYFGQQKVVIDADEESIPHVGIWEDDDYPHSERINRYWRAVGKSRLSGNDCSQPWSAAFISWVMQEAGVPESLFPRADAHKTYLSHFINRSNSPGSALVPHTIKEYKPQPGDLICANRGRGYFGEVVEEIPDRLNAKLHCDIVVQTDGQTLQAIGGNVRNSVSKTLLTLDQQGYLQLSSHRPWFLVIENRLDSRENYD
jgi:predicted small lipoprotein YifL